MQFRGFTIGQLPKPIYRLLQTIRDHEHATSRQVVVAGVLALSRLWETDRDGLAAVWQEARRYVPDQGATVKGAPYTVPTDEPAAGDGGES